MIVTEEVRAAQADGRAVVALESTLLAHGLPVPRNRSVAGRLEAVVREAGAVAATVAGVGGEGRVGLSEAGVERGGDAGAAQGSRRGIGGAPARGPGPATTGA